MTHMAVLTVFASVLGVFLSELKEPLELVIIVFLALVACGKYLLISK